MVIYLFIFGLLFPDVIQGAELYNNHNLLIILRFLLKFG